MRNRLATPQDRQGIVSLWQRVFKDDADFIEHTLDHFVGAENIYVSEENTRIEAILSAVPCEMGGSKGVYLYALATEPDRQGRGIMTDLLHYAEGEKASKGAAFASLIPADPGLFEYYLKRGYTQSTLLRRVACEISAGKPDVQVEFDTLTASMLLTLRSRYSELPVLTFDLARTHEVVRDIYALGASTAISDNGYAVFFHKGAQLLVAEMFAQSNQDANFLLQAIREKTGCQKAVLTLAGRGALMGTEGVQKPAALIKKLNPAFSVQNAYIRFALDESDKNMYY